MMRPVYPVHLASSDTAVQAASRTTDSGAPRTA
jgi:hypothetical protein